MNELVLEDVERFHVREIHERREGPILPAHFMADALKL
jgi:hypothetical protein